MIKKFIPSKVVKHYSDVNLKQLKEENYKLILCDIDNTLVGPDVAHADQGVVDFVNKVKENTMDIVLISNNTEERVTIFNETLNLKVYPMALKPLKKTYKRIKADHIDIKPHEMISLGDQVMTDVLGSRRSKIDVILTDRIVKKDLLVTKINRFVENQVIKYIKWRGKWPHEDM